jgi:hypothetical protein
MSEPSNPQQGPYQQGPFGTFGDPPPTPYPPPAAQPQYDAPQYAQPQYTQPQYGQPQYGAPQYGPPQYGAPQFGQPQYGQPQYGPPQYGAPQYGQPPFAPPPYGAPAPFVSRPGTIPLRPLRLADIFDGAFRSIRFAPSVMFGLTAVVVIIAAAAQAVPTYFVSMAPTSGYGNAFAYELNAVLGSGIGYIVSFLGTTILSGMLTQAVAQGAIGRKVTIASAWRAIGGRVPRLIGLTLLIALMMLGAMIIPIAMIVGAGVAIAEDAMGPVGLLLIFFGGLGMVAAVGWIAIRTLLAPATLVLEGQGVIASLKRGWRLTRGRFWRSLGIYLLASLIVGVISGILATPASFISVFFAMDNPALSAVILALATALSGLITTPFTASVVALLYIDARIRTEGLDLALMRAAEEPPQ